VGELGSHKLYETLHNKTYITLILVFSTPTAETGALQHALCVHWSDTITTDEDLPAWAKCLVLKNKTN